jgi:antitoxin CcdA
MANSAQSKMTRKPPATYFKPDNPALPPTIAARQALAAYDVSAPKRATNVSVNADLLSKARECGVNLSQALEDALKLRLVEERRRRWLEDNREAIEEYNRHFEKYGLWSDGLRMF